ncbi:hypothetical protein BDW02DRAFT_649114 [Decorospora gaudefroyi]|uniref:DUF6590 domain-containing protein n=1 Tax=Decorospora gaudefroyi TaxID=184978 RepID=A0A6A5K7I2_9PLEO|nr:hypothetical protein BDW02DRAFT_649114 [Decorospora gaudefroyi]
MYPYRPTYTEEWDADLQRHLRRYWDDKQQMYYRKSRDATTGEWHFFDWLPRRPAAQAKVAAPPLHQQAQASFSRQADLIQGTYTTQNQQVCETLDRAYTVRRSDFFREGTVFSVLFTEAAGNTTRNYNSNISYVRYGQAVYTQIRRFIVVRKKQGFCYACPIYTYGDQATTKPGVRPEEHAIAYSEGKEPRLIDGEAQLSKQPICIIMNVDEHPLTVYSRICFGIHHPIQHNVKVKHLGYVKDSDIARMRGYWKMESGDSEAPTNNPAEATAEATQHTARDHPRPVTTDTDSYIYNAVTNPHCYDPEHNPYGYHPDKTQYCFHPVYNPEGYHSAINSSGYHPESNPHGYHSVRNPYGYHLTNNPHGYHAASNPYGYHPTTSPYAYHPKFNQYGYHYQHSPNGHHPSVNPTAYHPVYNPRTS